MSSSSSITEKKEKLVTSSSLALPVRIRMEKINTLWRVLSSLITSSTRGRSKTKSFSRIVGFFSNSSSAMIIIVYGDKNND